MSCFQFCPKYRIFRHLAVAAMCISCFSYTLYAEGGSPVDARGTGAVGDWEDAACRICGIIDIAELPEESFEHFEHLHENPLQLNFASRARLRSSGLFTSYQIETLVDYRARCGDILSLAQLSLVDGFNSSLAADLSFFISFISAGDPSASKVRVDASAAGSFKANFDDSLEGQGQYMAKAAVEWKGLSAAISSRSAWSRPLSAPSIPVGNVSYSGKRWLTSLVAGYYNARFAQGLALWSGSVFNSVTTPSALMRRPSSIVPYSSYSSQYAMLGVGARMDFGQFSLSPFVDFSKSGSVGFGTNFSWNHPHGEVGITAFMRSSKGLYGSCSVDFQHTVGGVVCFSELAFIKSDAGAFESRIIRNFAFLGGIRFPLGAIDCAVRLSADKDEHNCIAAASYFSSDRKHSLDCSLSSSWLRKYMAVRYRLISSYSCTCVEHFIFTTRADLQYRKGYFRTEIRQDVKWDSGTVAVNGRLDFEYCRSPSFLGYAECLCTTSGKLRQKSALQLGFFKVDSWDDRIYVYQRDIPSSFNVPAMYGRGLWLSFYSLFRISTWGKLYLRCSYTAYPWARDSDTRRNSTITAKIEFVVSI